MNDHDIIIGAYRRILRNAERGVGVHLSADEVDAIANCDDAIRHAVEREDVLLESRHQPTDEGGSE